MDDVPIYELTAAEIQEFRTLLENALGYRLEQSDAEVEQMARNAIDLFWTLRDVAKRGEQKKTLPTK